MDSVPPRQSRILVVDDDTLVAQSIAAFLTDRGYSVDTAGDFATARDAILAAERDDEEGPGHGPYRVVLTDMAMPGRAGSAEGGIELIRWMREARVAPAALALTGYATVERAVEAIRHGAVDFLTKPLVDDELALAIERAVQQQALLAENRSLRQQLDHCGGLGGRGGVEAIVGTDPRMLRIYDLVRAVAPTRTTVLMTGESGTGKSLIARAIHRHSPRAEKPFVELSCGSIPETLLESELFGHVKGAFTGAHADKKGRFLAAHGGTLFLDEINSASPSMQLKLLRVLQERRFEAVGSSETIDVDVRVILASNQPLELLVASGQFRQDLYYRINVVTIELPPLRDRVGDIPHLANHFLQERCAEHGRQLAGFTPDALAALCRYPFPGNVRELENVVERAVVLCRSGRVTLEDLPTTVTEAAPPLSPGVSRPPGLDRGPASLPPVAPAYLDSVRSPDQPWIPMPLEEALREPERMILLRALRANAWNRQRTAEQLRINRSTLYKKMKSLGLEGLDRAG